MNLAKTQFLSLLTKGVTTALGIMQSIIIVRILSPAEFGLVGLVMSIGSVIGVSQHLGIVDGAIREIAVRKKRNEIGKVFWVSHIVRQTVTIPLSLGLMLLARPIAVGIYGRPEIVPYILIFAGALVLQGLQDVLGAAFTGMKKFGSLYVIQIVTAAVNVGVFGWLTWQWGVTGFFWAVIVTTSVMVVLLAYLMLTRYLRGYLTWPTAADVRTYGRRLMRIGLYMYASRIFFVLWQRLPILVLGGVLTADELGYLNVSLTFGSKLTIIAAALSEVNLSWMSSLYTQRRDEFARLVTRNMQRVLVAMLAMALVLMFYTPEILRYIVGVEYLSAQPLILLVTLAFFLYALTDIGTSSLFVSADQPKQRAIVYGMMTGLSAVLTGWLLVTGPSALLAAGIMAIGALLAYAAMLVIAKRMFFINMLTAPLAILLAALFGSVGWLFTEPLLVWRIVIFCMFVGYVLWEAYRSKLLPGISSLRLRPRRDATGVDSDFGVVCFAGAEYSQMSWTNRQHIMSRMAKRYPVLYVEPRVWIVRYMVRNILRPMRILRFLRRAVWPVHMGDQLYVKAQWNLLPYSRENSAVSVFNHWLNRWHILLSSKLKIQSSKLVVWIYDTEAAEYLSAFKDATVVYDCVDDHAAQAGVDRNPERVQMEEDAILRRADLVTVTSRRLFDMKKNLNPNVHLVLNAGDVELYAQSLKAALPMDVPHADVILGSVGALDAYKVDFALLLRAAKQHPEWQFVFIGAPVVPSTTSLRHHFAQTSRRKQGFILRRGFGRQVGRQAWGAGRRTGSELQRLARLDNVHVLGAIDHREVPRYVQQFTVCLIPYRKGKYNQASFPLKFWEFMATGKPIVASGVPELAEYKEHIQYISHRRDFEKAVMLALKDTGGAGRRQLARRHSWDARTAALLDLLKKTIQSKGDG